MKNIERKYLRKGVIYLLIALFDGLFSFFSILLSQIRDIVISSNPDLHKVLPYYLIPLIAFLLFLIFSVRGLVLISRYLSNNVSFGKKTAIKYLYKNEDRIRRLINEEGKSKIDTPVMIFFTALSTAIVLIPLFNHLNNLINISILNEFKIAILIISPLILLNYFVQNLVHSIDVRLYSSTQPEKIEEIDGDNMPKLVYLKTHPEYHFIFKKEENKSDDNWIVIGNKSHILNKERVTIYNLHKHNVLSMEKEFNTTGSPATITINITIKYHNINKDKVRIDSNSKGMFDSLLTNQSEYLKKHNPKLQNIIEDETQPLRIQSESILTEEIIEVAKPFQVITAFINYKKNLNQLLTACSYVSRSISSNIKNELSFSIKEDIPVLSEIIEINVFTSKVDLIDTIYKKADEKNQYFDKILMDALEEIKTIRGEARKAYVELLKKLLEEKVVSPNLLPIIQGDLDYLKGTSDMGSGIDEFRTDLNSTTTLADNIILIVKEISAGKNEDSTDLISNITNELQTNIITKELFASMDKEMVERFLKQLVKWLKDKKDSVLRKSVNEFLKEYFQNNKPVKNHDHY